MEPRNRPLPPHDEPGLRLLAAEETLVTDARAGLTPAQMVERRLAILLQTTPPPVAGLDPVAPSRAHFGKPG
jgi:hypothetical protein